MIRDAATVLVRLHTSAHFSLCFVSPAVGVVDKGLRVTSCSMGGLFGFHHIRELGLQQIDLPLNALDGKRGRLASELQLSALGLCLTHAEHHGKKPTADYHPQ